MLFGSSGIRRIYDEQFLHLVLKVGAAVSLSKQKIILGRDCRSSSPALASVFASGFMAAGGVVYDGGICPTPTVAYASRNTDAGCMITASHNPEEYNGLKLFNPDGSSYSLPQQEEIEESIGNISWGDWQDQGSCSTTPASDQHESAIIEKISIHDGGRMVVDCGNGAASLFTPMMLGKAGIKVISLNANPSKIFTRPSEPLEEYFPYMNEIIRKTGAMGGVVHDGDADRMMAFDNKGRFIPGDRLLLLFTRYLGAGKVVTTYDASMAIEEVAEVKRTPVGDAFVSEQLVRWGDFGGEPSGAWIFPEISYCPDGPYAAALFCEMASEWNVADELDTIPSYPILRRSIKLDDSRDIMYAIGSQNPTDGVRLEEDDGWCLIRASGTEPKIRLTAEGKTLEIAKRMLEEGEKVIRIARQEMK